MKTIAIVAEKGGAAKTTTALAISAALHDDGKRVLVVDLDRQRNSTMILADNKTIGQYQNITDALQGKGRSKPLAPCQNGFILPSTAFLSESSIKGLSDIKTILHAYSGDFDYCVIDCPPSLGALTIAALTAADFAIIPVKADLFGYAAVTETVKTIKAVQGKANKGLRLLGVLPCMVNTRTRVGADFVAALEELTKAYRCRLYPPIRQSAAIPEAQAMRAGNIFKYAPRAGATQDYRGFFEILKGDIE